MKTIMSLANTAAVLTTLVCVHHVVGYNTNRHIILVDDNCDYYENPVFQIRNRMSDLQPQAILIDNRVQKEVPFYSNTFYNQQNRQESGQHNKHQPPASFFPNITPANMKELRGDLEAAQSHEEEEEVKIDYDKLWKVGELPASSSIKTLPDVYVKRDDVPPIVDMMSMEKSELTEETHDMDNVEIQEKFLSEPSQIKEIFIETITTRPELLSPQNAAIALFQKMDELNLDDSLKDDSEQSQPDANTNLKEVEFSKNERPIENATHIDDVKIKNPGTPIHEVPTEVKAKEEAAKDS